MYNIDIYYRTSLKNTSVSGASWINIIIIIIITVTLEEIDKLMVDSFSLVFSKEPVARIWVNNSEGVHGSQT
jgi:hypothetical protein